MGVARIEQLQNERRVVDTAGEGTDVESVNGLQVGADLRELRPMAEV
jgi:hypothetical protein